jgi:monovalent cation/hydrogen antiporter
VPLPWLLERLGFAAAEEEPPVEAGIKVTQAALRRLDELAAEPWGDPADVASLRRLYESRIGRQLSRSGFPRDGDVHLRLRRELLAAERAELQRLERDGEISATAARQLERQLDLEESSLTL